MGIALLGTSMANWDRVFMDNFLLCLPTQIVTIIIIDLAITIR